MKKLIFGIITLLFISSAFSYNESFDNSTNITHLNMSFGESVSLNVFNETDNSTYIINITAPLKPEKIFINEILQWDDTYINETEYFYINITSNQGNFTIFNQTNIVRADINVNENGTTINFLNQTCQVSGQTFSSSCEFSFYSPKAIETNVTATVDSCKQYIDELTNEELFLYSARTTSTAIDNLYTCNLQNEIKSRDLIDLEVDYAELKKDYSACLDNIDRMNESCSLSIQDTTLRYENITLKLQNQIQQKQKEIKELEAQKTKMRGIAIGIIVTLSLLTFVFKAISNKKRRSKFIE